jgi:2,3-bisphosphoglycerate-independent phosphoglycerate mutase
MTVHIKKPRDPVALIILDGWGIAPPSKGNAVTLAKTPSFDALINEYPVSAIQASGEAVGLPWHKPGNSEVGHMNLGSGRIMYQSLPRIDRAIQDGSFFENKEIKSVIQKTQKNKKQLHLLGLISNGGVHSHMSHLYALLEFAKKEKVKKVFLHLILDGRDSPRDYGLEYLKEVNAKIKEIGIGEIATISGRYFTMDRDNRWERIQKSFDAMVLGEGRHAADPLRAVRDSYAENVYDEMIESRVITKNKKPVARIQDGDGVIFFNFRSDRARQITHALTDARFNRFTHSKRPKNISMVTFTDFDEDVNATCAFPHVLIKNSLGEVLAKKGFSQKRIAETEKYAHVTIFFNGGEMDPFKNEQRELVSSPQVPTYDMKPEMSAHAVKDAALHALEHEKHDFYCINFANPDMVGHTGNLNATIQAIETVDHCFIQVVEKVLEKDGIAIITADHGNAEVMLDLKTGKISKEHTANPVPFVIVGKDFKKKKTDLLKKQQLHSLPPLGVLSDVAPTLLELMEIQQPKEMTGISLLQTIIKR